MQVEEDVEMRDGGVNWPTFLATILLVFFASQFIALSFDIFSSLSINSNLQSSIPLVQGHITSIKPFQSVKYNQPTLASSGGYQNVTYYHDSISVKNQSLSVVLDCGAYSVGDNISFIPYFLGKINGAPNYLPNTVLIGNYSYIPRFSAGCDVIN